MVKEMATIDVLNLSGDKVGSLDLAEEVFGMVNEDLLWEAVQAFRAAARAGTHATKTERTPSIPTLKRSGIPCSARQHAGSCTPT